MNSIEQFIASHPSGQQLMDEARLKRRATKKLLADYDKSLREQIAREIMASNVNVFMTTPETIRAQYAAIVRGSEG